MRDLWPDIIVDMKIMSKYNFIYLGLKLLEKMMYKVADLIIYNSPEFKTYLKKNNKSLKLITNGIDKNILEYFKKHQIELKKKINYRMIYAGNLGIAQDLIILIDLAAKYKNELEIVLIGKGSQEELIRKKIIENKINNIKIITSLPRQELLKKYLEADILFLQLKNIKMFEKTIPSKIFEYIATGKPIIYGLEGIGKKILEEFEQNYYFKSNNFNSLCSTFENLKKDIKEQKLKKRDLKKLEKYYSREKLSEKYSKIIVNEIEER